MNYWPLLGIALVVAGFALRLNPALVVVVAGIATGLLAGIGPVEVLALLGRAFTDQRYLALFLLTLPAIGLLERHGLKERAQQWIGRLRGATAGRALAAYLAGRQLLSALGLVDLGGHAQTVRPLMAPMAVGAAVNRHGPLPQATLDRVRAMTAASENVGRFFGEDIFIAFGAVLLMQGFFAGHGIELEPLHIALWGIPTAICAFLIHAGRLLRMDARLAREAAALRAPRDGGDGA
jgi:Predicted membrane protein